MRSLAAAARVSDLHAAFADPDVAAILTVIGGFNSNELLPYLDWDLIAAHPKVLCGYSDITALQHAILARTGMVTYSGPHWSSDADTFARDLTHLPIGGQGALTVGAASSLRIADS